MLKQFIFITSVSKFNEFEPQINFKPPLKFFKFGPGNIK